MGRESGCLVVLRFLVFGVQARAPRKSTLSPPPFFFPTLPSFFQSTLKSFSSP